MLDYSRSNKPIPELSVACRFPFLRIRPFLLRDLRFVAEVSSQYLANFRWRLRIDFEEPRSDARIWLVCLPQTLPRFLQPARVEVLACFPVSVPWLVSRETQECKRSHRLLFAEV